MLFYKPERIQLKHSINGAIIKVHILTKPKESIGNSKVYFGIHVNINKISHSLAQQKHTHLKPEAFAWHNVPNTNWHCLKSYLISYPAEKNPTMRIKNWQTEWAQ